MQRQWMHLLLLLGIGSGVMCKSFYSIVAPGTIKSNRNYTICITLHDADLPCTFRASISGTPYLNISQEVQVQPHQTKAVHFVLPKLREFKSSYKLIAEGLNGCNFRNETELLVEERDGLHILIQTDKGKYKPGDLVQFRIVVLDEHLKPIKLVEPIMVQISDSKNNRVKLFKDIHLNKGIFTGNFSLSEQPNLGTWYIAAITSGKYDIGQRKSFDVEKYILPKFSVHIDTVSDFVLEDQLLHVTVYGKYTYGKYVEGKVDAKIVFPDRDSTILQEKSGNIQEDLKAYFEFDLSSLRESQHSYITVEATITEDPTNVSLKTFEVVNLHDQPYRIVIPENEIEFRNNKPYRLKVKVQYLNGTAVNDPITPVLMQHGAKQYEEILDVNGMAEFTFDYDSNENNKFYYKNAVGYLPNIATQYLNDSQDESTYCKIALKEGRLQLNSIVELEVTSPSNIPYFVFTIIGHSNIIHMEYVQLPQNQKSYILKIIPSIEMIPASNVYVHYIVNGNLRFCDIDLRFPNEFENKISISTTSTLVKPGQEVTLNIKAQPESRISLLAVDLSVHLVDKLYNINTHNIFAVLLNDKSYTPPNLRYIGQQSGLLTLTNANFNFKSANEIYRIRDFPFFVRKPTPLRSNFPETWIFKDLDITDSNTKLTLNIPDTITTWLVTAFSVNEKTGFGMMDESVNITVFQNIFISTNLPYSIKRGETIGIPVIIFNYYNETLANEIMMNNIDGEFQFIDMDGQTSVSQNMTKFINVPANSGKSVSFRIVAKKVGDISIRVTAVNHLTSDAIHQKLKVEPEGILKSYNQDIYLNLLNGNTFKSYLNADIPSDIIPDSEYLTLSLGGDVLVTTIEYLNDLIQLPTGCGEQNMINFVPNILVLDYLKAVGKFQKYPQLISKAIRFIEIGYQRELTYRHSNGGYSVFGPPGTESTWLTAYVIRFFLKAQKYVNIDSRVLEKDFDYLATQQLSDGDFSNTGYLFYPAHQNKYGFTAFVLMSFLENRKYRKKYGPVIEKGLSFLTNNIHDVTDTYALSIMANAFQLANKKEETTIILNLLKTRAIKENNRMWWSENDNPQANAIEITAYVLMALMESPGEDHFSIFRWLIEQRNVNGGFKSSQDTIVGLQALVKFSEKYNSLDKTLLKVNYTARDEEGQDVEQGVFGVDPDSILILHQLELPKTTRSINFDVMGVGNSLLQFSYQYYVKDQLNQTLTLSQKLDVRYSDQQLENMKPLTKREQSFIITPLAKMSSDQKLEIEICFKFVPQDVLKYQQTNMVILEINLPSGFVTFLENTKELLEEDFITRVELKNSDSKIVVYFNHLQANNEHCINIEGDKAHDVQLLKPSSVVMYDYYNSNLRDTVSYDIVKY